MIVSQPLAYSGELIVEGREFDLYAERIVIRDEELAFMFSGSDENGDFKAEGIAKLSINGSYVTYKIRVVYIAFVSQDYATIQFDEIKLTPKKLSCKVKGKWLEGGICLFTGNLRKFKVENR